MKIADFFYILSYRAVKFIAKFTPEFLQKQFINSLAFLFYKFDKKHTKIMRTNLNMCFKDKNENEIENIIKNTYKNFGYFAMDFLKNQNATKEDIIKKTNFKNEDVLLNLIKLNRPLIIQTAHFGNWELFALSFAARFNNTAIIGRDLDSAVMNEILKNYREKFNMQVFSKNGNAKDILLWLKNKNMLGILVDQNTSKKDGIEIEFFKNRAMHTPAASSLALKFNAIILPSFILRNENNGFDVEFLDPIFPENIKEEGEEKIKKLTQLQADATEKIIRKKPDEYFWMHKRFKHFYEKNYE